MGWRRRREIRSPHLFFTAAPGVGELCRGRGLLGKRFGDRRAYWNIFSLLVDAEFYRFCVNVQATHLPRCLRLWQNITPVARKRITAVFVVDSTSPRARDHSGSNIKTVLLLHNNMFRLRTRLYPQTRTMILCVYSPRLPSCTEYLLFLSSFLRRPVTTCSVHCILMCSKQMNLTVM